LVNIYQFCAMAPTRNHPRCARRTGRRHLGGRARGGPLAAEALDIFVRIYGCKPAISLACPYGGLYVAGGIAPKSWKSCARVHSWSFLAKGRMASVLSGVPVKVVLNARVGLLGRHSPPAHIDPATPASAPMDKQRYSIHIDVETHYIAGNPSPEDHRYVFATPSPSPMSEVWQLLTRHWIITDANGRVQVRGEGWWANI
jgi:hypothetical protein